MTTKARPRLSRLLVLAPCCAPLLFGCAEERPPINRVQSNALSKEFFVGDIDDPSDDPVFLWRNFVVDASESQELIGVNTASGLERVRFEITENTLFARRAYSITGGDNKGTAVEPNGDIVAAFEIESQFDIRRAYSSATGEELNVVEENSNDRPWQEREYFRVDWSENKVVSPVWDDMFFGKIFGSVEVTPVSYYVSDQDSSDAPHFDPEEGYFDITSHFSVAPETTRMWGTDVPLCLLLGWFTGSAIYSCEAQEAVIRSSFWRIDHADPDDDFEPFENTHGWREIFGNPGGLGESGSVGSVTPPREKYDPGYGYTEDGVQRYMNVHDLWKQSHQTRGSCDSDADCERVTGRSAAQCLDSGTCSVPCSYEARGDTSGNSGGPNGTDDQCENGDTDYDGSEGAQCSPRNRCTIPYRDRDIKPVAYFVNPEMPDALQDVVDDDGDFESRGPTEDIFYTWNQTLQLAVARAREVECRRTAKQGTPEAIRSECHSRYFLTEGGRDVVQMMSYGAFGQPTPEDDTDILVSCHNPVRSYDPAVCGAEGSRSRVGDLRKNFVVYWPYHTQAPFGGIGNWRADPVTGQIVGAAATTIGASTTYSAAQARDLALVALNELDFEDITNGVPATRFQRELRDGRKPRALSVAALHKTVVGVTGLETRDRAAVARELSKLGTRELSERLAEFRQSFSARPDLAMVNALEVRAAAEPLLNTTLELDLMGPDWLVDGLGMSPTTPLDEDLLNVTSPLRGQELGQAEVVRNQLATALGMRGVCHVDAGAAVGNPDVGNLGPFYKRKYPNLSGEEFSRAVYEDLWKETYKGIQLHEVGHSLGLLHNFASSYDSLNYDPQYWQLRTGEGNSVASCEGVPRGEADTCMGPRYLDPESEDELGRGSEPRLGIDYFAHTSTMEYQNTRLFETIGLGQYDVMTVGALYGRVLETFDPQVLPQDRQELYEGNLQTQLSEDWTGSWDLGDGPFDFVVHYTELARQLNLFDGSRCRPATNDELEHAEWRIVHGKVCMPPSKDYGHWDDFVDQATNSDGDVLVGKKIHVADGSRPAGGNFRWPFRYGGDIMNSYPHVNPFDSGADLWELTDETIRKNDYDYPLAYFRRQRRGWDDNALPSRTARNFYERLRSYHWAASSTKSFFESVLDEDSQEFFFGEDNLWRPTILAQAEMFHGIANTLLIPEPGEYAAQDTDLTIDGVTDLFSPQGTEPVFVVDPGDGRFVAPDLDSSPSGGGSWDYGTHVARAGYYVEKQLAARALTDGRPVLSTVSRGVYLDDRSVNINFRANLPSALDRLLGGVLAEDWTTTGPFLSPAGASSARVTYRDFIDETLTPAATNSQVAFPNLGFNQQIAMLIYPQLFGRLSGDLMLANKMRVWLDGSLSGQLDIPEAEQVRFTDPESGITYIARSFGTETFYGKEIDKGIASRMIQRANELMLRAFVQAVDENGDPVVDEFGRPAVEVLDGAPVSTDDDAAHIAFRRYVGLLDAAVQLSTKFGHGPL
jgi:hypothetical protein